MIRTCLLLPTRRIGAVWPLLIVFAVFIWLTTTLAAHPHVSIQGLSGWAFHSLGKSDSAYFHQWRENSVTTKHPWHDTGMWLMGDTHVHHRQTGLERVVDEASQYGCDYLAFTEHAHYTECLEAQPGLIEKAHAAYPNMLLVNGMEWSTPAGNVVFRIGQHPDMKINQFLMAPYFGPGVPHEQRIWIDDLRIYTSEQDVG